MFNIEWRSWWSQVLGMLVDPVDYRKITAILILYTISFISAIWAKNFSSVFSGNREVCISAGGASTAWIRFQTLSFNSPIQQSLHWWAWLPLPLDQMTYVLYIYIYLRLTIEHETAKPLWRNPTFVLDWLHQCSGQNMRGEVARRATACGFPSCLPWHARQDDLIWFCWFRHELPC